MKEKRFTMGRRTFIKTTGGLIIMKTFSGRLSPAHAASPPSSLEFKSTVARWVRVGESGALDSSQQGQITVTPAGQNSITYPIQDGSFSFVIPNNTPSEILLEVNGMSNRTWGAELDSGTLIIKNHDYNDTPLVYHWLDDENAYILEYWQDDLYVTGPADPGGYFLGYLYAPLSPLATTGRLPLIGEHSNHPPVPAPPPPDEEPQTGPNGLIGVPDNNTGVSTGSSPDEPAGNFDKGESQDSCKGCGKPAGSKAPLETRAGDMVPLEEIRIPIVPSLAALDQKRLNPRLENINFGAILRLEDPSGNEMGAVFVGLNQEAEIAGGITMTLTHLLSYPIDQVVINTSWPRANC